MEIIPFLGFHEPFSSLIHLITALCFLFFGVKLVYLGRGNWLRTSSLIAYIVCGVFLFSMSGVYHLLDKGTTGRYVLRILDHAGIYLMISGSFTPFQIILLRGVRRWIPLVLIWVLAITGLTLTAVFFDDMPEALLLTFFIGMGWMSLFTVWFLRKVCMSTIKYIFIGGVLYTMGAIFDFMRWPILLDGVVGPHELFHLFISLAAVTHLIGIYRISELGISEKLVVHVKKYPDLMTAKIRNERAWFKAKTDQEIKTRVKSWVDGNYLKTQKPKKIKLKYSSEEYLS